MTHEGSTGLIQGCYQGESNGFLAVAFISTACPSCRSLGRPCLSRTSLHRYRVRLSRKFRKLLSLDAGQSLWEHVCRSTHPVSARRILGTIDRTELERLRERYPYRPNARKINAYEDAAYWIGVNVKRAQDLWLDRSRPLQILDLGCGAGYFSISAGYLVTMGSGLIQMRSRSFAEQLISSRSAGWSGVSNRKRPCPTSEENSIS